jgi:diaminopimelate decarboxylase
MAELKGFPTYFSVESNTLILDGVDIQSVASNYGTPLYVYLPNVMNEKLDILRTSLPEFEIYYSVKANPLPAVLQHLISKGCGLEVASLGEMEMAIRCGCQAERVLFAGPGKTDTQLQRSMELQIGQIHVESLGEMNRLAELARQRNQVARIAIRINPGQTVQTGAMQMGGKASVFGIDEENLQEAVSIALENPFLNLNGIHVYAGTQILNADFLADLYIYILELADKIVNQIHRPLNTIDFGGGLGIPYFSHEQSLDLSCVAQRLKIQIQKFRQNPYLSQTRFIIEPGRFLVGESGVFICRITEVKESRGTKFIVLDGGMNFHLAASGNLGQVIKRNYPVVIGNRMNEEFVWEAMICGPLCTPMDVVGRQIKIPSVKPGDIVCILCSGAYSLYASPINFLGHARPAEVFIKDRTCRLVRPRGTELEFLSGAVIDD